VPIGRTISCKEERQASCVVAKPELPCNVTCRRAPSSPPTTYNPPPPPQHGIAQHGNNDLGHETSLSRVVYGGNPLYEGYLYGRESSIEDESSIGSEEDDSYEEDNMDEFMGWPPELLLTPQPTRGLQRKQRRPMQGASAGMAKEGGEGRGWSSMHAGMPSAVCEGRAGGFGSKLRGEGARSGEEGPGSTREGGKAGSGGGGATQRPLR
jgi:hypothetical protein